MKKEIMFLTVFVTVVFQFCIDGTKEIQESSNNNSEYFSVLSSDMSDCIASTIQKEPYGSPECLMWELSGERLKISITNFSNYCFKNDSFGGFEYRTDQNRLILNLIITDNYVGPKGVGGFECGIASCSCYYNFDVVIPVPDTGLQIDEIVINNLYCYPANVPISVTRYKNFSVSGKNPKGAVCRYVCNDCYMGCSKDEDCKPQEAFGGCREEKCVIENPLEEEKTYN